MPALHGKNGFNNDPDVRVFKYGAIQKVRNDKYGHFDNHPPYVTTCHMPHETPFPVT